jgi:hypothetical protein
MRTIVKALSIGLLALGLAACGEAVVAPTTFEVQLEGPGATFGTANVSAVGHIVTIDGVWEGPDIVGPGAEVRGPGLDGPRLYALGFDNADNSFGGSFTLAEPNRPQFTAGELYIVLPTAQGDIVGQIQRP